MNQIAGSVNAPYRKNVPAGLIVSMNIGLVNVMKNPVTIKDRLPILTARPLIFVGNISLMIT